MWGNRVNIKIHYKKINAGTKLVWLNLSRKQIYWVFLKKTNFGTENKRSKSTQ